MNRKNIGVGIVFGAVIVAASMYLGMINYPQCPSRIPDVIGKFQRGDSEKIILRPLDNKNLPFVGISREEIRKKMKESLFEEMEVRLADEVVVIRDRRKSALANLEAGMTIMIWYKMDGSNEAEFVSIKKPSNKKID